jgi:hypothetical protein
VYGSRGAAQGAKHGIAGPVSGIAGGCQGERVYPDSSDFPSGSIWRASSP